MYHVFPLLASEKRGYFYFVKRYSFIFLTFLLFFAIIVGMEQLDLFTTEKDKICAFTGHRYLGADFSLLKLKKAVKNALKKGYRIFLNGMAMGFDLTAAEVVLSYLDEYPDIRLIACIPCLEQDKYYTQEDKTRYHNLLLSAEKRLISTHYHKRCMLTRNDYMVERADMLIAYCKKPTGGTAYTVNQFSKRQPNGKIVYV